MWEEVTDDLKCSRGHNGIDKKPLKTVRPDCRQFDLENRETKVTVKVTIEINRTCYWLPSGKVSCLLPFPVLRFCLNLKL